MTDLSVLLPATRLPSVKRKFCLSWVAQFVTDIFHLAQHVPAASQSAIVGL
jgi:hypothetical protein